MSPRPAGVRVGGRVGPPAPAPAAPERVRALLAEGVRTLRAARLATARQDAEWLLAAELGVDRLDLYTDPPAVDAAAARRYAAALARRAAHEPLQHLLGWEEFRGLRFWVGPAVLIPRPETELLVEWVLELAPPGATVCDLGTGSGCVAAALAAARPDVRVLAVELSAAARAVAARNLAALGLADRVTVLDGDLFEPLARWAGAVDLIVANPPYIPTGALRALPSEVRAWEPRAALDGGPDGMAVSRRIIDGAPGVLARGGALAIEIGDGQAPPLAATLRARGFVDVRTRRDLGGVERYLAGAFGAAAAHGSPTATLRRGEAG
jgi:release factor glutamine methyltransferase